MDTELVRDLITEVLQEKVATMLGYPKPEEKIAPPAQEVSQKNFNMWPVTNNTINKQQEFITHYLKTKLPKQKNFKNPGLFFWSCIV